MDNADLYRQLYRIRRFEETVLENFPKGVFFGTTHTYLGQEANAVGILSHLQQGDIVFSNHRCHGHFLACGGEMRALFAEMMGKVTGVCGGRGGSQHLHWRNFYSNGVQGGIVPIATGMALAEKRKGSGALTVVFLGDGTLGEGVIYESFNMAALWGAPILYVVENNKIAQTTPLELALAGDIAARFQAFGISAVELDSSDVLEVSAAAHALLNEIRADGRPRALILHTVRFGPHSKGDDTRDPQEIAALKASRDPLAIHAPRLTPEQRTAIEEAANAEVESAFRQALADPLPIVDDGQRTMENRQRSAVSRQSSVVSRQPLTLSAVEGSTVLDSLNAALHQAMAADERLLILGEDLLDPYGGAFKVTRGLSERYPERVLTTPISEAGFVGVAAGMALRGLRPVVEIMFGDFITLAADQIVNHIAKFRWMYNDQVRLPLVIRTPMGGRRGYGPTHSQTLEKHFLGLPGLKVLAPTALGDPGALLRAAIADDDPVLFIENKLLYLARLHTPESLADFDLTLASDTPSPTYFLTLRGAPPPTLTLAAYGYMAELARQAALQLAYEDEIFVELVVPTQLSPFAVEPILASARRTGRLLTVEEGTHSLGWGAEVLARAAEALGPHLHAAARLAAAETPIPASGPLEEATLPGVPQIVAAGVKLLSRS